MVLQEKGLSVLIVTDLEGVSGVRTISDIPADSPTYPEACKLLMGDTNAAVEALFHSGADKVYVLDGHGGGNNFIEGMLDERATSIRIPDLAEVIKKVSAVVVVGVHAMAGTINAFLDHTQSSAKVHGYFYNGKRIGELSQMGVFASLFGVPIVAVTGDAAACKEALSLFPGVSVASVKTALRRNEADCLPITEARELIYHAVKDGFHRRESIKPIEASLPLTVEIEFNRCDYADDAVEKNPRLERVDAYKVREIKTEVRGYLDVLILF